MQRLEIYPGHRFGRLVVVREGQGQPIPHRGGRRRTLVCRCTCGAPDREYPLYCLTSGATKSCGCLRRELAPVRAKGTGMCKAPQSARQRLAARVAELEERNRRLTAELGMALSELEMARGHYR